MPRPRLAPRVIWRDDRGKPGTPSFRAGSWIIRDGVKEVRLGLGRAEKEQADIRLARYHVEKRAPPDGAQIPERFLIADALAYYGSQHAPTTASPDRIGYAIKALLPFWGDKSVSAINKKTCREYATERRVQPGTIRRELGLLRTALNFCVSEGKLTSAPPIALPERPPPRERWLTREEAAHLIRIARGSSRTHDLVRMILIGTYSGTRPGAILKLRWAASLAGGHVDLKNGVLYRKPAGTAESRKRRPPARMPRRRTRLMAIWRQQDERFCRKRRLSIEHLPIVHFYGRPIHKLRSSWRTLYTAAKLDETVVAHSLRHTAITWAAQAGADPWEMCGFFGITMEELQRTYLHHHPDYQSSVTDAFDRRRAAR